MSDTTTPTPKKRGKKQTQETPAAPPQDEQVVRLPLSELHSFKGYPALRGVMPGNQPYQVRDDDPSMQKAFEAFTVTKLKKAQRRESVLGKLAKFKEMVKKPIADRQKRKELEL